MKLSTRAELDPALEEHIVLRVPPELTARVRAVIKPLPRSESEPESISISRDPEAGASNAIFTIGKDQFSAKLRNLPTILESWKTKAYSGNNANDSVYYKSADIGQVLEVSNVRLREGQTTRPAVPDDLDDGLTPPMSQATERFRRMDRTVKNGLPKDCSEMVRLMDIELKRIVTDLEEIQGNNKSGSSQFVYEELIDMEPFMQYWDTRTIIKQGDDNFLSESRKAYDLAWAAHNKALNSNGKPASNFNNAGSSSENRTIKMMHPSEIAGRNSRKVSPSLPLLTPSNARNSGLESVSQKAKSREEVMSSALFTKPGSSNTETPLGTDTVTNEPISHNSTESGSALRTAPLISKQDQASNIVSSQLFDPNASSVIQSPLSSSPNPNVATSQVIGVSPDPMSSPSPPTASTPGGTLQTPAQSTTSVMAAASNDPTAIRLNEELIVVKGRISTLTKAVMEAVERIQGKALPPNLKKKFLQDINEKKASLSASKTERDRLSKEIEARLKEIE